MIETIITHGLCVVAGACIGLAYANYLIGKSLDKQDKL
tara:strand:+ start:133 stop:246 length:114 start_codon:yes stop_codon:yes gene_type:complete